MLRGFTLASSDQLAIATRLVDRLKQAATEKFGADRVALHETHISWVLLIGDEGFKFKKPVDLGFVDFTSLARREFFCKEELRLNARLAPDLYLDVVPVTGTPDAPELNGDGESIEFAVRMRRFPEDALLSRVLADDRLLPSHIDDLAEQLADFHASIPVADNNTRFGSAEVLWQQIEANFSPIKQAIGDDQARHRPTDEVEHWTRREFDSLRETIETRKRNGFVRECHGDMHLGNMLLWNDRVTVFDCIEFNDELRWIDVMSEVAFALMDLAYRDRRDFGFRLLNRYLEHTGDYSGVRLLRLFAVYRALVRAKVAALRLAQDDSEEQAELVGEVDAYLRLATDIGGRSSPVLVITHGLSGSGKSSLTEQAIEQLRIIRVRSDVERKRQFGLKPLDHTSEQLRGDVYSTTTTVRVYERCRDLCAEVLAAGFPVIVDATFLKRDHRALFRELAADQGVKFHILQFRASDETLRARIQSRSRDASEANLDVLAQQLKSVEPLTDDELATATAIETEQPQARQQVIETLRSLLD